MLTRKTSSRKAKDAAAEFVRKVISGKWEDYRDVVSPEKVKKSPAKALSSSSSPARSVQGSPARSSQGSRPISPAVCAESETKNTTKPQEKPIVEQKRGRGRPRKFETENNSAKTSSKVKEQIQQHEAAGKKEETVEASRMSATELPNTSAVEAQGEAKELVVRLKKKKKKSLVVQMKRLELPLKGEKSGTPPVEKFDKGTVFKLRQGSDGVLQVTRQEQEGKEPDDSSESQSTGVSLLRTDSSSTSVSSSGSVEKDTMLPEKKPSKAKKKLKEVKDEVAPESTGEPSVVSDVPVSADLVPEVKEEVDTGNTDEKPDLSNETETVDELNQSGSMPYPSDQAPFFNIFGLVKKSDIKDDSLRNKLHREAGGKLRRIVKPKMNPEMVYKKLTLAKGCVIEGMDDSRPGSSKESSPRLSQKARNIQAEQLKPKVRRPVVKLTMLELQLAENLLKVGDLKSVRHLLLEGRIPVEKESPKKKEWLKPPPKKKHKPNDQPKTDSNATPNVEPEEKAFDGIPKVPMTKTSSFGSSASDKEEGPSGTRRSSRQQGQRKQWWHLLRAAPDEYEVDKEWDEEQNRLLKKRKALKDKRDKMFIDHLSSAAKSDSDPDEDEDGEEEDLPSSQGSTNSAASSSTTHTALKRILPATGESKMSKKKKKTCMSTTSDINLYADLYEDLQCNKLQQRRQDWDLAKKVLKEAMARGGNVSIESILLDIRKKELLEEKASEKAAQHPVEMPSPLKKKKKKKKKEPQPEQWKSVSSKHSDIIRQIKPLLKSFMDGTNKGDQAATLEMELNSQGDLDILSAIQTKPAEAKKADGNDEVVPQIAMGEWSQCRVPHMCCTCWINDHMYCTNMKKTARDLPPFGGCLHYAPCNHYRRRKTNENKNVVAGPSVEEVESGPVTDKSILKPVTERDLFCMEQMPESDESAPQSPRVPEGTELLKVQLKARAAQIAECLGGESPPPARQVSKETTAIDPETAVTEDTASQENSEDAEVPIIQHGAEMVCFAGRCYPPNHEILTAKEGHSLWLESLSALKQSPGKSSPASSVKEEKKEAEKEQISKVKIRLQGPDNKQIDLENIETMGKHKLVRVKVQRVGNNKIILKQTQDCRMGRNNVARDVLVREIDLPTTSEGNTDNLDTEWLSGILAAEAVKLASKTTETLTLIPRPKKKRSSKKQQTPEISESLPVPAEANEELAENVAWAVETISDDDSVASLASEKSQVLSDEDEADVPMAQHVELASGNDGSNLEQSITIRHQAAETPENPDHDDQQKQDAEVVSSFTTKDIRDRSPQLMDYIKNNGLARTIYQKLEADLLLLKDQVKESDSTMSKIQNDREQDLCLRAALQSEKGMLQDDIRTKRDEANRLGQSTANLASKCSLMQQKLTQLEDDLESYVQTFELLDKAGITVSEVKAEQQSPASLQIQEVDTSSTSSILTTSAQYHVTYPAPKVARTQLSHFETVSSEVSESLPDPGSSVTKAPVTSSAEPQTQSVSKAPMPKAKSVPFTSSQMVYLQPVTTGVTMGTTPSFTLATQQTIQTSTGQKMVVLQPVPPTKTPAGQKGATPVSGLEFSGITLEHLKQAGLKLKGPITSLSSVSGGQKAKAGKGKTQASQTKLVRGTQVHKVITKPPLSQMSSKQLVNLSTNQGPVYIQTSQGLSQASLLPLTNVVSSAYNQTHKQSVAPAPKVLPVTKLASVAATSAEALPWASAPKVAKTMISGSVSSQKTKAVSLLGGQNLTMNTSALTHATNNAPRLQPVGVPGSSVVKTSASTSNMVPASVKYLGTIAPPSKVTTASLLPSKGIIAIQANPQHITPALGMSAVNLAANSAAKSAPIANVRIPNISMPKGVRVHTASGQVCNLPQLSPSVMKAIGPNDQVVVLTAEQLKQLQKPPFRPVQIRLPLSSSANSTNPSASISRHGLTPASRHGLTPIAPKPTPQRVSLLHKVDKKKKEIEIKMQPPHPKRKRSKDGRETPVDRKRMKEQVVVIDPVPHQGMVGHSQVPSVVQEIMTEASPVLSLQTDAAHGDNKPLLGPMEAFEVQVQQQQSQDNVQDDYTDLVQLAMEDSQIPVGNMVNVVEAKPQVYAAPPQAAEVIRELNLADLPEFASHEGITFEIVNADSYGQSQELLQTVETQEVSELDAVTVEVINPGQTPITSLHVQTPTMNIDPKTVSMEVLDQSVILENYSAIEAEDKDCCEFEQFLDDRRDKEVYSQEVYIQNHDDASDTPQQVLSFELM